MTASCARTRSSSASPAERWRRDSGTPASPEQRSKQRADGMPAVDEEIERGHEEDESGRELDERSRVDELEREQADHEDGVDACGPERGERGDGEECHRDRVA